MSSDGKPLWGFRSIFFLCGVVYGICAVWSVWGLVAPDPEFARTSPPGSENHFALFGFGLVSGLLGAACFWFWRQLRLQRFTSRNWIIGLLLQLPFWMFPPFGLLCSVVWCSTPCREVFHLAPLTLIGAERCQRIAAWLGKIVPHALRVAVSVVYWPVVAPGFLLGWLTRGRHERWLVPLTAAVIVGIAFPASADWANYWIPRAEPGPVILTLRLFISWCSVSVLVDIGFGMTRFFARELVREKQFAQSQ